MKIDKKLNLVSTIERDDGSLVYLHVTPLPYEVVEINCVLLGSMFNHFFSLVGGLGAPRVAAMMLRTEINDRLALNPELAGKPTIIDDIHRMISVIWSDNGEWKKIMLEDALKRSIITEEELREVEGELVFFTVGFAIQKANLVIPTVGKALEAYSGQLTSLNITEYIDSLPKSKTDTNIQNPQAQPEQSFIPS
ncbi:hypothetical protein [Mangrovibacter phragmitis]|uniref:hypothetical protein n=1 Tax=Mangrovibacter phragmitis TaxID=1691903 RepID=UPI00336AE1E7